MENNNQEKKNQGKNDPETKQVPVCQKKGELAPLDGALLPSRDTISDLICRELIGKAREAMQNAYAPYSDFKVGAALLAKSKKIYTGCNVENAAYSPTICAERTAFAKAVCEGERDFRAIAVLGGKGGVITDYQSPCGVCRQVMMEFCQPKQFYVILARSEEDYWIYDLEELFPMGFSAKNLDLARRRP